MANTAHEKIQIVKHEDFMAPAYLPTFNINLELNLHRIKGLSEHFVFFNDDMFLIDSVKQEDFFKNGLPCDCCIETALVQDNIRNPFANILMNDAALVNMHYNKKEVIKKQAKKWFSPAYGAMLFPQCADVALSCFPEIFTSSKSFFESNLLESMGRRRRCSG